ncbi:LOW QUALITY PROTEIN: glycosylphosphatidylinositol anchor attachment 1 protein-like [Paramacrobiotus metropolitanus]|uniref:LOW QUALITY PROTEIN: glycosylphosphatidylinositol anchor attachment 1 protein-like n=1 Tax=Paramacrobiotus metropolitanus TaxID=2943436 RepID=UPI0024464160|nr:LOW QUALITY PROTEIN: glycosylphosphatidylinositol anchor attachment 1 protein-like [Paramacrobiotus metropolitanus]
MGLLTDPGRNDQFAKLLGAYYMKLSVIAYVIGVAWLFCLVDDNFTLKTYFSENALLPGLVQHEFSSLNENYALKQHRMLMDLSKEDSGYVRERIKKSFQDLGLDVYDHYYNYSTPKHPDKIRNGHGVYAIVRASRANSLESIVISAPLRPANTKHIRTEGSIALMLALAQHFRHKNYWSKDIIFLVTDNEHFGAKAWVEAYHGCKSAAVNAPLYGRAGSIQAAINLEIPSPDIDYLDLRIVGINGQLPNLDLVNLVKLLLYKQGMPFVIHGFVELLERTPHDYTEKYLRDLKTTFRMVKSSALGRLEGNHGFFQQYNVQSLTIKGIQSMGGSGRGRIGFYRLAVALEGICRSLNNLLERFHQSFFFYLMTSPNRFISIGMYTPPFGLLILPLVINALALWARDSSAKSPADNSLSSVSTDKTSVAAVLPWLVMAHVVGVASFMGQFFLDFSDLPQSLGTIILEVMYLLFCSRFMTKRDANCLKSLSLIEMAIGLYALSMLNFPLALLVALFAVPVAVWTSNDQPSPARIVHAGLIILLYPIFPVVLSNVWHKLPEVYDPVVANDVFEMGTRSISAMISEYFEYGNWLDPVTFLFLMPLWILHWMTFWAR